MSMRLYLVDMRTWIVKERWIRQTKPSILESTPISERSKERRNITVHCQRPEINTECYNTCVTRLIFEIQPFMIFCVSPVDQACLVAETNFALGSYACIQRWEKEKDHGDEFWCQIRETKQTCRNTKSYNLATLKAVSVQTNGMLMIWKIKFKKMSLVLSEIILLSSQ